MEQLKLLMDYTIFHAGVYITLGGLMVALVGLKAFEDRLPGLLPYLVAALGCFLVAGFCSGIIASNIPYHREFDEFIDSWIGPWIFPRLLPAWLCMSTEHTAFWTGVATFLFGFWRAAPDATDQAAPATPQSAPKK
jgi:hypothetical protein